MLDDRARLRLVADFHRDNAVVELLRRRPRGLHVIWIAGIDTDGNRSDADDLEHRAHQVRFVFTITIRLGKDFSRSMRTITAAASETRLNRDVLDLLHI